MTVMEPALTFQDYELEEDTSVCLKPCCVVRTSGFAGNPLLIID